MIYAVLNREVRVNGLLSIWGILCKKVFIRFGGHFYRSPYCTMYIYILHFSLFRTAYSSLR